MLKKYELSNASSCLNKAEPDEPVFVLRAKDPLAAQTVRLWAAMAGDMHPEKVGDALHAAEQMEQWHGDRFVVVKSAEKPPMPPGQGLARR